MIRIYQTYEPIPPQYPDVHGQVKKSSRATVPFMYFNYTIYLARLREGLVEKSIRLSANIAPKLNVSG